jgi:hypothetical protein
VTVPRFWPIAALLALFALWVTVGSNAAPGGKAAKTPAQILAGAERAVATASSVRLVAVGVSGGKPLRLDLELVAGRGGEGSVTDGGYTFRIVRLGTHAYFEAGAAFWRKFAGSLGPQLFQGRWIEASATSGQLASFTPLTSMRTFINGALSSHGTLAIGKTTTIGGRPALRLIDTTQGGSLYLAATGAPYPLEITANGGAGTIRFESWNQAFPTTPPKNALDFTKQLK